MIKFFFICIIGYMFFCCCCCCLFIEIRECKLVLFFRFISIFIIWIKKFKSLIIDCIIVCFNGIWFVDIFIVESYLELFYIFRIYIVFCYSGILSFIYVVICKLNVYGSCVNLDIYLMYFYLMSFIIF